MSRISGMTKEDFIKTNGELDYITYINYLEHELYHKDVVIKDLKRIAKKLYNYEEIGTGMINSLVSYGIVNFGSKR